ncbi:MAG: glycoside hydrolase family 5 protein [Candidatus Marinimicrobia bacterium]|nr:glycoside hydrolase family 5 protein [Candidatus Neomarinimicrobiota bacterium]MCF7850391.1 glycoside hydrolase family 5 protein [Candidatus Neomarinimicrobiota bacterium]MCF7904641.1 glycoside hydrolase family 5 protein [Candidatus Neomarinimicrobiota bacterium]
MFRQILLITPLMVIAFNACVLPTENSLPEQKPPTSNAWQQNDKLARSMNLGNALEAAEEGDWGLMLEEEYFEIIAEAGFSAVRLPCKWSAHTTQAKPYTIDPEFLARVDWAIDQAEKNGLAIVVNVHHYDEFKETPLEQVDRLHAIWNQLATHFQDRSDNLILELFNEPNGEFTPELWNMVLVELVDSIRSIDSSRTLMVGTANWGGISGLDDLVLPSDSNLIVTVHYYNPFHFTHQGAEWVDNADDWLGTSWGVSNSDHLNLESDFDKVQQWSKQHDRPIFVGEFGAYSKAEMVYRIQWTKSVVSIIEQRNMAWAYWEFASGFGAYDLNADDWTALLPALIQD